MESLSIQLQPFFEWLLRATIQASLLICLILLLQLMLQGKLGPRGCHALWLLLLIRMVMPWAPQSRISIFNLLPQREIGTGSIMQEAADSSFELTMPGRDTNEPSTVTTAEVPQDSQKAITAAAEPGTETTSSSKPAFFKAANMLPFVWLAGALALAVYVCTNNFTLLRIVRRERPLTEQRVLDLLEDCKAEMGIRTILGIVPTDKVKSAALFGFVRPRLLLPKGMLEALSREELRYVFLHELAHLKRHDIYIGWLMSILQVLHWFNPFVWLASYRIRADSELACDALVLARTQSDESKNYGQTIVNLLERFSQPRRLPAMAGILETKSQLKRRITMIAQFKNNSYRWSALGVVFVIVLACVSLPDALRANAPAKPTLDAKAGPTLRRVMDCTANAAISPDARFVCYPKYDDSGELVVHNLVTGKQHIIKASAGAAGHESDPLWPVFSPDGRTIAYMVVDEQEDPKWEKAHQRGLYLIGTDGSNKRLLCRGNIPIVWSSDGKRILVTIASKDDPSYIVWVSTEDGSIEKRVEFPKRWQAASLSPDGRYLAFDRPQEGDPNATWYAGRWDIFALDLNSGQQSAIVRHPAGEVLLGWAPSGKHILFLSDRMGTWDAWLQPVADGVPAGQTQLVCRNLGHVRPGRFAQDGSYYYQVEYNSSRIYFGEIDPHTAQVVSAPKALEATGYDKCVDWSPDGRYAAFCSRNPDRPGPC
ncbi:MAG: M56 family metallopeptidase, partial [Sedimentisphaerales bacterium]